MIKIKIKKKNIGSSSSTIGASESESESASASASDQHVRINDPSSSWFFEGEKDHKQRSTTIALCTIFHYNVCSI